MPFDQQEFEVTTREDALRMVPVQHDETLRVLQRAREWLSDPAHWCKGTYFSNGATCVRGAVLTFSGYLSRRHSSGFSPLDRAALDALDRSALAMTNRELGSMGMNDHPDTTHADVIGLVDHAISARLAELEGGK